MKLFEPTCIGPLELKNRLVMTAMSTRLAEVMDAPYVKLTDAEIEEVLQACRFPK